MAGMKSKTIILISLTLLAGVLAGPLLIMLATGSSHPAPRSWPLADTAPGLRCETRTFEGATYHVVWADPDTAAVRLYWNSPEGGPFTSFDALAAHLASRGEALSLGVGVHAAGAGGEPPGLLLQNGALVHSLNAEGEASAGGIFYIAFGRAAIVTVDAYTAAPPPASVAVQSAPLLVRQGEVRRGLPSGPKPRASLTGMGVNKLGQIAFVLVETPVDWAALAQFFVDSLDCVEAMGLGGGFHAPCLEQSSEGAGMAGVLAVVGPTMEGANGQE